MRVRLSGALIAVVLVFAGAGCAPRSAQTGTSASPASRAPAAQAHGAPERGPQHPAAPPAPTPVVWPSEPPMPGHAKSGRIVVLGDSVVSGSGITQPGETLSQWLGQLLGRPAVTIGGGGITATLVTKLGEIPGDTTTVVVYAGSNDVVAASTGVDRAQAERQIRIFEVEFDRLAHGLRERVPQAELAFVTVRDLGRAGLANARVAKDVLSAATHEWDAHERAVAGTLGVRVVIDTETDPAWYVAADYTPEGFHPRNVAVAKLAHDLAEQLRP